MDLKLSGNDIIANFAQMKIAEFDKEFVKNFDKKYFILRTNFGLEMLSVYVKYRSNMHIASVMKMLEEMEQLHTEFQEELSKLGRNRG